MVRSPLAEARLALAAAAIGFAFVSAAGCMGESSTGGLRAVRSSDLLPPEPPDAADTLTTCDDGDGSGDPPELIRRLSTNTLADAIGQLQERGWRLTRRHETSATMTHTEAAWPVRISRSWGIWLVTVTLPESCPLR